MSKSNGGKAGEAANDRQPGTIDEALRRLDAALRQPTQAISEIASEDFAHIKTAVAEVSSQVIENAVDALGHTGEALKDLSRQRVQEFAKVAQDTVSEVSRQSAEAFGKADRELRANPWPYIGAAALGALIGGVALGVYMNSKKESGQ